MKTTKLVQITTKPTLPIGLDSELGRINLAKQIQEDIETYVQENIGNDFRTHLGASEIGHQCERYLWYKFRWMFKAEYSGRMLRLFDRGHLEETRFIEWLTGIGFLPTGKPLNFSTCGGHFGGTADGVFLLPVRYELGDILLLVEFKTQSTGAAFTDLKNEGIKAQKPLHWSQMCTYGFNLGFKYGIYMVVNKNDDDLHIEILELDHMVGMSNTNKANRIITSMEPPPRISEKPTDFRCKWCDALKICHLGDQPIKNCRSCVAALPHDEGQWFCARYQSEIPDDYIEKGCDQWIAIG